MQSKLLLTLLLPAAAFVVPGPKPQLGGFDRTGALKSTIPSGDDVGSGYDDPTTKNNFEVSVGISELKASISRLADGGIVLFIVLFIGGILAVILLHSELTMVSDSVQTLSTKTSELSIKTSENSLTDKAIVGVLSALNGGFLTFLVTFLTSGAKDEASSSASTPESPTASPP